MEQPLKFSAWPVWANVFIYFGLLGLATLVAGAVPVLNGLYFFFMVSFLASWALLACERRSISDLGFIPQRKQDLFSLVKGAGLGAGLLLLTSISTIALTGNRWQFNSAVDGIYLLILLLSALWSSFVQEFTFRGYPFQRMLPAYGVLVAQTVVAIAFGLMHIQSGMTVEQAAVTMLTTGLGSVLFGLAYLKTKRLFLPIGLHWGWNFCQGLFPRSISQGKGGLFAVAGTAAQENMWTILLPYVVVTCAFIWILSSGFKESK